MDKLSSLNAFVVVSEEGNFTKAAAKLNMSTQLVSKYISQLEEHLGTRLFNRTTRKVHITDEGEMCLQYARQIINDMDDLESQFDEMDSQAKGLLSISAPVSFATLQLSALVCDFRSEHPKVGIDLELNDRKVDLIDEGYDVAFRIGQLQSSSMIAKKLAPIKLVLTASPGYLKKYGLPKSPAELDPKHYLGYSYMEFHKSDSELMNALKFNRYDDSSITANNGEILAQAAIAGEGYTLQPTFIVGDAIRSGQLKHILRDYEPEPLGLYLVYPHRKLISNRLRVFIDFCGTYYNDIPDWDKYI